MRKITLTDFEKNPVKSKRWLGWLSFCLIALLGSFSTTYGQGNTCIAPLTITNLPYTLSGDTASYGDDYETANIPPVATGAIVTGTSYTYYLNGDDVVFKITPSINGTMTVNTSFTATYGGVFVFTGCPFTSTLGYNVSSATGVKEITNLPVIANTTYYIVISTWAAPQSSAFTLNITGTPGLLTPPEACVGTPVGGTASLTPNTGNATAVFTANATGVTLASGLTYQWQKSINGTWQDIAGATSLSSQITAETGAVGTSTDYRLAVTCTASAETAYSTTAAYTISLTYCVPTVSANNADEIRNFTLSNLNNNSAASEGVAGYKNYAGTVAPAQLSIGVPYVASLTGGTGSGTHGAAIWIDYNQNGTFEASEKVSFIGNTIGASATATFPEFIVPNGTPLGIYRLRVQHHYNVSGETLNPCVATSQFSETEDYNVEVFPTPTCLQPSGLTASNLTGNSAQLSWTSTGSLFNIEWGTQGFVQGTGTTVNGVTFPYTLNTLLPNTSYSYYVRTDCGVTDGLSLWSGPYTFKTPCVSVTGFFENFDTALTGTTSPMPDCWSKLGNGTTYVSTGSVAPNSPANRLYMFANGTAATPTEGFAILPAVSNLQGNSHRLKFKAYASTTNKTMEVGYFTDLLDIESFVTFEVISLPGTVATTTEFIVEPYDIPAGVTNLVFRNNAPTASTTLYIDDVSWEPIPLCDDIITVQTQTFNSTSAIISWENGGGENAWEYVYAVSTVTSPAGLTPVAVTNNPIATLSNLNPNTTYKIWIRSNCGNNALGNWPNTPYTFTTSCEAVTVFSENFDSYTATGSTNPLPTCWTRFGNTGSSYITTGSVVPFSPANRLYLSASATTPTDAYAVMPPVSNLQAETHRLRFKGFSTAAGKAIEIGYFELAGDASSFVVLETFEMPSTVIANATEFIYTPEFVPPGIESLAFKVNGGAFTGTTTMYIDDVIWEELPPCGDIIDKQIENVSAFMVDISWMPGGTETAWQYVYALSTVTDPSTLTPEDVTNNPYLSLTGLQSSTSYNLWIRSNCGSGVFGSWSTPITFTTTCAPIVTLPWTEGFEQIATVSTTAFPPCWFEENGDWASAIGNTYNTPKSGTKYIRNSWSATNEFMWTPGFELTAGTSYDFSFFMQGDGHNGWNIDIFQNTTQISANATQLGETISPAGIGSTALQEYTQVSNTFIPTTSGIYYFAIRVNQASTAAWYVAFDDFKLEVTPTCIAPSIDSISTITSTTATVSWSSPSTATNGFEYFLTTDSALIPTATTTPTGTVAAPNSSIDLTNLTPSTVYYIYVRALCSDTDISSWSFGETFKTACTEVNVFTENFDSYTQTGSANPLPTCWMRAGNGSTYITTGSVAPNSPANRLYMSASGTATVPTVAYAIMPPVSNLQANTHRLKFKAYASTTGKYIEIGYLTTLSDLTSFVLLETIDLPGTTAATTQTFTFESALIPAGISSLVFRNPGTPTATTTLYIDDVIWEPKPTVAPVCATNVVATPNATCGNFATAITWNATPDADGYYLNIGTTAGGTDVLANENIGLVTSYSFIGNFNTTYYYSVIPFNSAGPATGCTEQTFTTAVNGCYCVSVPSSNDNSGITNVLLGTQNFPTTDVTYFNHTANTVDLNQGILSNLKISFATGYTYSTIIWIDFNDDYNFTPDEIVFTGESLATNPTIYDASFMMPMNANLGAHRMRIVATDVVQTPSNPCYNGTYGITLDFTVNVLPVPTCLAPTALTVNPSQITTTSATVSWIAPTTTAANGYEYYYTTSTDVPTITTTPSGTFAAGSTSGDVTGLNSSTVYRLYIRAVCSDNDRSAWSTSVTFITLCEAASLPYTIDFESVTVPALPICTSNQNVGTGNNWTTVSNPGNGFTTKALKYGWNGTNAANTWFFTNRVNLVAGTQYTISYNYGSSSTTYVEKLKVAYGTVANSTAMTTELADHPNIISATLQENTVTFSPTVSGFYVFGFNAYSIANQFNIYVDNIVIQEVLSSGNFDNKSFTAYPNPVKDKLNVRFVENISSATVYNILGQELFVRNINNTEGQIDMSNLASGTYLVKVVSGTKTQTIKVIKE